MASKNPSLINKLNLLLHRNVSHTLTAFRSLSDLKPTLALLITSGRGADTFVAARLIAAASAVSGGLPYVASLFAVADSPSLFMYNSIFRGFSQSCQPLIAIHYYAQMRRSEISPDNFSFPFLLKSCSALRDVDHGRGIHCQVIKHGFAADIYVVNNAISMYSACGDLFAASKLFNESASVADVVSWTALVTGFSNLGELETARKLFDEMPEKNLVSWNAMIAGYSKAGRIVEARELFDKMPERNSASWSSMVSGLVECGKYKEALEVFDEMTGSGIIPNEPAVVSAVSACAALRDLEQGEKVHLYMEENELEMTLILGTALVDMYGKCGCIEKALKVFKELPEKNLYTWNSMITGLALNGSPKQAMTLFWKMRLVGLDPNDVTFIGLLSACSHSGSVEEGRRFFNMMTRDHKIQPIKEHYGCMVDLLGRAGLVKEAVDFADKMPVKPHAELLGALVGASKTHGDTKIGERVGRRLIELEPQRGGRYVLLANIYASAERWDEMLTVRRFSDERKAVKVPGNSKIEEIDEAIGTGRR